MLDLIQGKELKVYDAMAQEAGIPDYMVQGYFNYVEARIAPGDFLLAILRNDLVGAVFGADQQNLASLRAHMLFCTWCIPGDCWGSRELVEKWLAKEGQNDAIDA